MRLGSAGLGLSILPATAIHADHRVLGAKDGLPAIPNTELALVVAAEQTYRALTMLAGHPYHSGH